MTSQEVTISNESSGVISIRDIYQNTISENLERNLDTLNQEWIKSKKKNSDFLRKITKQQLFNLSKQNLFFKNTFFKQESIYFEDIYVPLDIEEQTKYKYINNNKKIVNNKFIINDDFYVENLFDQTNKKIINIVGCAGQGKSTILSKIYINQLKNGNLIPIYISFRSINTNVIDQILRVFEDNGVELERGDIISLLRSNKFILILDAFDEISSDELKLKILNEIVRMSNSYGLSILTSSRPETRICLDKNFKNYNLNDLNDKQINLIIEKTLKFINYDSEKIFKLLEENKRVKSSIKTPLLAILFIKIYPEMDIMPEYAKDFYDQIFLLLYSGHDKYKDGPSISRNLLKNYERNDTKTLFSLLCFISFLNDQNSFVLSRAHDFIKKGLDFFNSKIKESIKEINIDNFLSDIIECTSLLVFDGTEKGYDYYSFLHKTIQEYHAAIFFKDFIKQESSEDEINNFLEIFINQMFYDSSKILEYMKFYSAIDQNFSKKKIFIPFFEKFIFEKGASLENNIKKANSIILNDFLEDATLKIDSKLERINDNTMLVSPNQIPTRDNGKLHLTLSSTVRNSLIYISEIYGISKDLDILFEKLADVTTDWTITTGFLPKLTRAQIRLLENNTPIIRNIEVKLTDLIKRHEYAKVYQKIQMVINEISIFLYESVYQNLISDIERINKNDNINNSVQKLFSI